MKKRVVIGDLHGIGIWKDILNKEKPDSAIFLGDYFDSFNIPPLVQKINFDDLLDYKANHPNTILLLGNHDFHYLSTKIVEQYSGYNNETQSLIGYSNNVLDKCLDDGMNIVYIDKINQTIYSHAGVSQKWMNEHIPENNLQLINTASLTSMKFTYRDGGDWYGSSEFSSPIWIRPEGLLKCPYKDNDGIIWNQVYGHTNKIQPTKDKVGDAEFWDIDCLGRGYYMVELMPDNGKIFDRTIKRFEFDD